MNEIKIRRTPPIRAVLAWPSKHESWLSARSGLGNFQFSHSRETLCSWYASTLDWAYAASARLASALLEVLAKKPAPLQAFGAACRQGVEEDLGMAAQLLGNRGAWLPLLPTLMDELADQGAFVLAGFVQQVIETVLGVGIEPDGKRHGPQGLAQYDE